MPTGSIFDIGSTGLRRTIGRKAVNLRFLMKSGYRTPRTLVCSWRAYQRYLEKPQDIVAELRSELSTVLDPHLAYAVRSSANVEDGLVHSFAGQFKTVLDARGIDEVLNAIETVWASAQSSAVRAYLAKNGLDASELRMAVMIQEMVEPAISGVAFSKNPLTGLDEVVVESVEGGGEALVQQGVTPQRWINKWGNWIVTPQDGESNLGAMQEVVRQTRSIAKAYGSPVDLEWVYDGRSIHWVQLREITSLDVDVYSNRISREVFPGTIKPLVWSINVPLVNGAWVRLFTELIGPNNIDPKDLAKSFHCRAYFNMGAIGQIFEILGFPRESLELLLGLDVGSPDTPSFRPTARTYSHLPRMLRFAVRLLGFGKQIRSFLPDMRARYQRFSTDQIAQLSEEALVEEIERLYDLTQQTAYYNIVTPLLMHGYNRLLKSQLARLGVVFESLDLTGDLQELEPFDPNAHLERLSRQYSELDGETRRRLRAGGYDWRRQLRPGEPLRRGIEAFIERFGHLSDSGNDFSAVPWREDPEIVLQMVANYKPPDDAPGTKRRFGDLRIPLAQRPLIRWTYRRARRFIVHREAIGSLYTYGYGLFRAYFLALGDRLSRQGILRSREDIFYLDFEEVKSIVAGDRYADYQVRITKRREEIETYRDIPLPSIIYGDKPPPVAPKTADTLRGTPTSRGHFTGPVTVVHGIRDFETLDDGDVLVIPYSDVGWTPLFARAGAVVAESGGLLSHSSIVAREYGIPAVVSVPGACQLGDNTIVTVDGYRGEVIIHEHLSHPRSRRGSAQTVAEGMKDV